MRMKLALLLIAIFFLVGCRCDCDEDPPKENDPPKQPATSQETPFSISCKGTYTVGDDVSVLRFSATVSPMRGKFYMYYFDGYNSSEPTSKTYSFPRVFTFLRDTVTNLKTVNTDIIEVSGLRIERLAGKFKAPSTNGACERLRKLVPLPSKPKI